MNIEGNQEKFLIEISSFKKDLISTLNNVTVEDYREEYKGRYSPERFKEFFIEKTALHMLFKYILIRMIEESMGRVKVKLNEDGLNKWHQMSKNYRKDYKLLMEFAINDVKREPDLEEIFKKTIYDEERFNNKTGNVLVKYIPIIAKYDFSTLDANITLTIINRLYNPEAREELQNFLNPSPTLNFLLEQVGLL